MSRPPTVFVLSAGRTGTVFLTHTLPERFPRLVCHHEPPGSRSNLVFANARNLTGLGTRLLRARFRPVWSDDWRVCRRDRRTWR